MREKKKRRRRLRFSVGKDLPAELYNPRSIVFIKIILINSKKGDVTKISSNLLWVGISLWP